MQLLFFAKFTLLIVETNVRFIRRYIMDILWILGQLIVTAFEITGMSVLFLFFTKQFLDEEEIPEAINDMYEYIFGFLHD